MIDARSFCRYALKMATAIPQARCYHCGYVMIECTGVKTNYAPSPGDVSICAACGAIAVFNSDLTMREPTQDERERIERDPLVTEAQIARADIIGDKIKNKKR